MAHELGHWHHHRGQLLFCRSFDIGEGRGRSQVEVVANRFAADLLMPAFLFGPRLAAIRKLSFSAIEGLAEQFGVSRTAAAIRAVELGHAPAVLVCHGPAGLKWFKRAPMVPDKWWPTKELSADSAAFNVQFGKRMFERQAGKVRASAWFSAREAERFIVAEETVRSADGETLTILLFEDRAMLGP